MSIAAISTPQIQVTRDQASTGLVWGGAAVTTTGALTAAKGLQGAHMKEHTTRTEIKLPPGPLGNVTGDGVEIVDGKVFVNTTHSKFTLAAHGATYLKIGASIAALGAGMLAAGLVLRD